MARALVITEATAERHTGNVFAKLGLASRAQLAVWAVKHGLVQETRSLQNRPAHSQIQGAFAGFPGRRIAVVDPRLIVDTRSGGTQMTSEAIVDSSDTECCIVVGGPAGAVLALLLASQGISVTLLEAHNDFDRDFRDDVLQPAALDLMGQMGLAERVLDVALARYPSGAPTTPSERTSFPEIGRLKTPYPFMTYVPQVRFLQVVVEEAQRCPTFRLVMGGRVEALLQDDDGHVRGVRYRAGDGWHEVRTQLVVAADGPFSRVRSLAGLEPCARRRLSTSSGFDCNDAIQIPVLASLSAMAGGPSCTSAAPTGRLAARSPKGATLECAPKGSRRSAAQLSKGCGFEDWTRNCEIMRLDVRNAEPLDSGVEAPAGILSDVQVIFHASEVRAPEYASGPKFR